MKKVLLGFALLTFTVATKAQEGFSKGNIFLTGGFNVSSENDKDMDTKTSSFTVSPTGGYFVSDNLAVGLGLGIGNAKTTMGGNTEDEMSAFTVGGFARYYFKPKSKFSMYGHLGVNYGSVDYKTIGGVDVDAKANAMDVFVAPGMNYWISDKLALDATIGKIGYSSLTPDGGDGSTSFDFSLDLTSIHFGLLFKLK